MKKIILALILALIIITPVSAQTVPILTYDVCVLDDSPKTIKYYGAVGDGITDDTMAIQRAIDHTGLVYFPPGEYAISRTLVVSNNGVTFQGCGTGWVAYMYGYSGKDVKTSLKWIGEEGGVMLKIGDGTNPNAGCSIRDLLLDGNGLAKNLLVADATYYLRVDNLMGIGWRDGFGIVVTHSKGVRGSGEKYHTWTHVTLINPYENGSGIDIAPGWGNINQITFESCNIARSNIDNPEVTSLRLGYADHISFFRCTFIPNYPAYLWRSNERFNPYAITVQPVENHRHFPMNISFFGTSIYGGINYNGNWLSNGYSSLLFYPFYSADGQKVPPAGYINGKPATLPIMLIGGFTDRGIKIR